MEKHFFLVGITEKLNDTVKLLEASMPNVLNGLEDFYHKELKNVEHNGGRKHMSLIPNTESILRNRMKNEIDFYEFIERLFKKKMKELH